MIPPKVAEKLMDYIDKSYSGGIDKFIKGGGDITYLPESIIVSFPKEDLKLQRNIGTQFYGTPFLFFSNPFDTDANAFSEIRNELIKILMEDETGMFAQAVSISLRSCYILIQSMANLPKALVKKIRAMTDEFEVPRVLFFQPGESIEVWETIETKEVEPVKERPTHKGETVISSEQITNLKIDLNKEQDVMDFLKSLEG